MGPILLFWQARAMLEAARTEVYRLRTAWACAQAVAALPDEITGDTVQRYDSHLIRSWLRHLHELQDLQDRREGRSTPAARPQLDV